MEDKKAIIREQVEELGLDIFESSIDTFVVDNPIINFVPIAAVVKGIIKTYKSVSNYNKVKQTLKFMEGVLNKKENEKYVNNIEDPKELKEEIERTQLILERINDERLSFILGNIFRAYVKRDITLEQYEEINFVFSNLAYRDYQTMEKLMYVNENGASRETHNSSRLRLIGLGLIYFDQSMLDKRKGISAGYHGLSDIALTIVAYGNNDLYSNVYKKVVDDINDQENKIVRYNSIFNYDGLSGYVVKYLIDEYVKVGLLKIVLIEEKISETRTQTFKYLTINNKKQQ